MGTATDKPLRSANFGGLLRQLLPLSVVCAILLAAPRVIAQDSTPDWQKQVRQSVDVQDWTTALHIVDQAIAQTPGDMDVRAWRARVLTWSGRLPEAETEYLAILKAAPRDPDHWLGLATVYTREQKNADALKALDTAIALDSTRADVRELRAQVLRNLQQTPAQAPVSPRPPLPPSLSQHLQIGQDNDQFNFAPSNHQEWISLESRWAPHWTTNVVTSLYQWGPVSAAKWLGSVTAHDPIWGAVTLGGALGDDHSVIPKEEWFFDLDHGVPISRTMFLRAVEVAYDQHWYWYQGARVMTLGGTSIFYLPRDWMVSLSGTEARSVFPGTGPDWKPSGVARVSFPLANWKERQLSGSLFAAGGTEDFGLINQIGQFSSQTYGGAVRFQITPRQEIDGDFSYQMRSLDRTDIGFGLSYGIRF